jgi:ribosome maturation factor RimP
MLEKTIERLLEERFTEEDLNDCFLVDILRSKGDKVEVFVDSDSSLTLAKCRIISRYLEKQIEEKGLLKEKYTLEVSSPGLDRPLKLHRQYVKNIGRKIRITDLNEQRIEGVLTNVTDEAILITSKMKKEEKQHLLKYEQIKEAKILASFK